MDDTEFSKVENGLMVFLGLLATLILAGLIFAPETFWDNFLKIYVWDPIVKDAGVSGDASYSLVNTGLYIGVMIAAVVILQALFRRWQIPCDDRMIWALIAWVALAPVLRVLEDADFFNDSTDIFFISPIIHLHLASWLILSGLIGKFSKDNLMMIALLLAAYTFFTAALIQPNWANHEMGTFWAMGGSILGAITIVLVVHNTSAWDSIPRSMLAFSSGLIVMGLGHWAQLFATPWIQDSNRFPVDNEALWPLLVVIGIPTLITWVIWKKGVEDLAQLRLCGYEPGVIPDRINLKDWEAEDRSAHPVEMLTPKGILATPMVAGILFGQLCDGLATMVGIDWFGYKEKHPISDMVIQFGDSLGLLGNGAWLFFLVKALLVGLIVFMFTQMRVESRQQHLRALIVLAVMIVGMAPGLRDIGRLVLGV